MNEWMNNPLLKNMNPKKLQLIKTAAEKSNGKSGKELGNIMMSLIANARKQGLSFTSDEISCILGLMKEGKTKTEQAQIDQMITFARSVMKKNML